MRIIKFRAWDGKKMLPPEDLTMSPIYRKWLGKIDCVLMQFTGLLDKNGKEIYEGDIVRIPEEYGGDIFYKSFIGYIDYDAPDFYVNQSENIKKTVRWCGQDYNWNEIEIIGNIYENPELLNQ